MPRRKPRTRRISEYTFGEVFEAPPRRGPKLRVTPKRRKKSRQ